MSLANPKKATQTDRHRLVGLKKNKWKWEEWKSRLPGCHVDDDAVDGPGHRPLES